ncbi:replication endonuclease [uncultured Shewanella sp.]|uniref:replication endonuclease n=1 Tax=uncultured Shewanella sp. TaxID=173975 RepID=UPI00262E4994|nr:replication endonuclease [uncultured Shewanella sp.]
MPEVHKHDKPWLKGKLYGLPSLHKAAIMRHYKKQATRREANLYVLHTTKAIAQVLGKDSHFYSINVEDKDHKAQAKYHARSCIKTAATSGDNLLNAYNRIIHYITGYQITPPKLSEAVLNNLKTGTLNETELAQVVGVLKRANDEAWWKPKLRRQHNRQIETISRLLNQVNKHRGIYASNITVDNFKTQWQNNQELLENTIATNELDYSVSLAELSKLNVSNPAIRKAELMVRIRGFEDYAKQMGYSALFLTMTTPSKYHRSYSKSGDANPNWNGATPLDAQDYLNRTFQRIRASLNRDKISPFGFRIAEPHHDGTPHWHLLLFIPTVQQKALVETFEKYCLEEDGDEQGAKERRFKVEYIDPDKGSATGYVVKYVSKNIDGEGIDHDSYGKEAVTSAVRIKVWASCWGIRQFQQIGGVGVTQWRELRRLEKITDQSLDWVETIRKAADESNWSRYTELMGGVFCKRSDQPIRPLYANKIDKRTETTLPNAVLNTTTANELTYKVNRATVVNPVMNTEPVINLTETTIPNAVLNTTTVTDLTYKVNRTSIANPVMNTELTNNLTETTILNAVLGTEPATELTCKVNRTTVANSVMNTEFSTNLTETTILSTVLGTEVAPELTKTKNQKSIPNSVIETELATELGNTSSGSNQIYKSNRYGDALMTQLKGIVCLGVEIITRVHEWTLTHAHKPNTVNLEFCQ